MTLTIIECAVQAANEHHYSYSQALDLVVTIVESQTGFKLGSGFTLTQIKEEMSKYSWK